MEAIGAPETSCAPNAQQSTQATPSAATARSDDPAVAGRDPGQAKQRQGREDDAATPDQRHAGHGQVRLVLPIESRSVSMPMRV